jgi:hypothetical protein
MGLNDVQPKADGALDEWMSKVFGRSWKTTLSGLIALACGVAPLIPGVPPVIGDICRIATPIVVGGGLALAKDKDVSGGKRKV